MYARVSRPDEHLENQLKRLREYAQAQGYEVTGVYQDVKSGADKNRPDLERMMADARGRRFQAILVVKVDRIARSNIHLYDLVGSLTALKIKFIPVDQPEVSTESPTGKALLGILGVMAELERDLIRERTKAGLARVRAEGKHIGRKERAIDLKRVEELKSQGWGIRRIAKELGVNHQTLRTRLKTVGVKITRKRPPSEG